MLLNYKDRLKAFFIHFLISFAVIFALLALAYLIWFPNGMMKLGAIDGLKIIFLVDLVLGPVLTLVVFNKEKKSLKWDLAVIALMQISGLVYGAQLVYQERPVAVVMSTDGVYAYSASEFKEWELPSKYISHTGPQHYYLKADNDDVKSYVEVFTYEALEGKPYATQVELYQPLAETDSSLVQERIALITERMSDKDKSTSAELAKQKGSKECSWLVINSKHILDQGFACFAESNGVLDISLNP